MFRSWQDQSIIVRNEKFICRETPTKYDTIKVFCPNCKNDCKKKTVVYESETEVELHREIEHQTLIEIENQQNICLVCGDDKVTNLKEHILVHHLYSSKDAQRIEQNIYACNDCNNIFFHKGVLEIHIILKHSTGANNKSKINCPLCYCRLHVISVRKHIQRIFRLTTCEICLKKLRTVKEKIQHSNMHRKYLKCECCQYETIKSSFFNEHLKTCVGIPTNNKTNLGNFTIGGIMPKKWYYKMPMVVRGLNLLGMLQICILCRHICNDSTELNLHLNSVHSDKVIEKKTKLKICSCGMEFSTPILLKHHIFKMGNDHKLVENSPNREMRVEEVLLPPPEENYNNDYNMIEHEE